MSDAEDRETAELRERVERLERRLDLLLEATGLRAAEERMHEVDELIRAGKRVHAVKRYRELTGARLLPAKLAVDKRAAGIG